MKKILFFLVFAHYIANGQTIKTIAGDGSVGYSGDGGNCSASTLSSPQGMVTDNKGNLYFADLNNHCIRKISAAGIITTIAGNGIQGYNGDDIPGTAASLSEPHSVAVDTAGNVYVGDYYNHRVRKVDAVTGMITTVAGTGTAGFNGHNIPATNAMLNKPSGVAIDENGNLFISDYYNNFIRKVNTAGIISKVAGTGGYGYSGDNGQATNATMREPYSIAVDKGGNLYITDIWNHCIRKVDATGMITTIAGTGTSGYSGDGGAATKAQLYVPQYTSVDAAGNVYIADASNGRIRKIDAAGNITTIAGDGVQGYNGDSITPTGAELRYPAGVTADNAGNIYIADQGNNRIRYIGNILSVNSTSATVQAAYLYPNPANNEITMSMPGIQNIVITDITGKIMISNTYTPTNKAILKIDNMPNGMYIAKINGIYAGRFVKQ